ncbi:MAG: class I SAM-dependent methyltransferase [Rhodobacteraceae bacterium]|nr:class I SAM-dependent methyltransferase [Paracoccaceae bacterium]
MSLEDDLKARIRQTGPLTVAEYMNECLLHPLHGYYMTRDPLGASGDFTTAPEISQMFGELLGLSLAQSWLDQGRPTPFTLAELGPGRGTLIADVMRATRGVPGFHDAARILLLEASPTLRRTQSATLQQYEPDWINQIEDLPEQPLFLIANEFFDALPIRQFVRSGAGWCEKQIGVLEDVLAFGLGAEALQPALEPRLADTRDGDLVEICDAALPYCLTVAARIAQHGGAALIVDYGDWHSLGDTLQALRGHASAEVLSAPGTADLTAHVDFESLAHKAAAAGATFTRLTPQGIFLERLGITDRARSLAAGLQGDALEDLIAAHRRLTHPEEMGQLFKVLGLYPDGTSPPPGLEA